ncbi:MAG: hypothetical protein MUE44_31255 [Oscillatoriaceae cyanobacterium Prado104]|nr:hypothetical protein [Oscillatoriaceae cyanobacterium Prado104]
MLAWIRAFDWGDRTQISLQARCAYFKFRCWFAIWEQNARSKHTETALTYFVLRARNAHLTDLLA